MALSIGNTEPITIYIGDQELDAIYLGDQEIWTNLPVKKLKGVYCYGLSYINTLIEHGNDYKLEIDCSIDFQTIFGQWEVYGYRVAAISSTGKYKASMISEYLNTNIQNGTRCLITVDSVNKTITLTPKDGGSSETFTVSGSFAPSNSSAKLLYGVDNNLHYDTAPSTGGIGIIYGSKLWNNNVLTADIIPAQYKGTYSGKENPIGLFDKVSKTMFIPVYRDQSRYPGSKAPFVDCYKIVDNQYLFSFSANPKNESGSSFNPSTDSYLYNIGYGGPEASMYVEVKSGSKSDQIRIANDALQIEGYAHVKRGLFDEKWSSMWDLEWSVSLTFDDFSNGTYSPTPTTACARMLNMDTPTCEVYFDFGRDALFVCPSYWGGSLDITTYDNFSPVETEYSNKDRYYFTDINLAYMQNGVHNIKIGKKGMTIWFFFDNIPLCSWVVNTNHILDVSTSIDGTTIHKNRVYWCLGTFDNSEHRTPKFSVMSFDIDNRWLFESLLPEE